MERVVLCFVGVISFVNESDVRADWLSGIEAMTTEEVMGLVVFWEWRATRAVVIVLMAFQSSSLSSVRVQVGVVAWVAQCWFGLSGGRRAVDVGLVVTKSESDLDHSKMSLSQSGPDALEIKWSVSLMLSLVRFPLMAVEP